MGGGYKTHCLSPLVQADDYIIDNTVQRHDLFFNKSPVPADLKILAIDTLQVAVRKENIAYAIGAADNGFFTMMDTDGTDVISGVSPAISQLSHISVYPAKTGADHTMVKFFHCPKIKAFRPLRKDIQQYLKIILHNWKYC
jgi:hypothetical protein